MYLENVPLGRDGNFTQTEDNLAVYVLKINTRDYQGIAAASTQDSEDLDRQIDLKVSDEVTLETQRQSQASLMLPKSLFKKVNSDSKVQDDLSTSQRIIFVVYRETSFFQSLNKSTSDFKNLTVRTKNSYVIAGSVKGRKFENLTDPVVSTYKPLKRGIDETTACVFWDFNLNNVGDWSSEGCRYQGTKGGIVTCHCDHLTNFAILMVRFQFDQN